MSIDVLRKRLIPSGSFRANVVTLMTGTTIAQIITILSTPLLTRIYTPEDFGLFALFTSITSTIIVVATARYELAIMLPDKEEDAVNIVLLSIIIAFFLSVFVLVIIFFFNMDIAHLLGNKKIASGLHLAPLFVFLNGVYHSFNYWSNRKKQYRRIAISRITLSISTFLANLIFGFMQQGVTGLIWGGVIGFVLATAIFAWQILREDKQYFKYINKNTIIEQSKAYSDFPKKSTPGALLNVLSSQLPLVIISVFYGPLILGFYSLTMRVLNAPMSLIGTSISQVFYERATKANRGGSIHSLVKSTTKNLFYIIVFPMAVLMLFGKIIFSLVFGAQWAEAGTIAQIMAPFFLIRFIFSVQSTILMVKRKMGFEIKFNFYFLITQIMSLVIGKLIFGETNLSWILMSLSGVFIFLYLGLFINKVSRVSP